MNTVFVLLMVTLGLSYFACSKQERAHEQKIINIGTKVLSLNRQDNLSPNMTDKMQSTFGPDSSTTKDD